MMKPPSPSDPPITYVKGFYWLYNFKLGSSGVVLYKDGHWHRTHDEPVGITDGPLPLPTEAQIASWKADYAVVVARQWAEYSHVVDPCWFDWVDDYDRGNMSPNGDMTRMQAQRLVRPTSKC